MSDREENKRKLDELLGIASELASENGGIDDYINGIGKENPIPNDIPGQEIDLNTVFDDKGNITQSPHDVIDKLEEELTSKQNEIQDALTKQAPGGLQSVEMTMNEVDSLVDISKRLIQHVYSVITSADILDAATISAGASLIRETRGLIEKHLDVQKEQRNFINKIQLEELRHKHQIELMERRYELDAQKYQRQNPALDTHSTGSSLSNQPSGGNGGNIKSYSTTDLMRMLDKDGDNQ